jgi:radical SAM family uncharacterized protein/radical SAM-linked protein
MHSLSRTIEEILPLVTKPSRYLGNEFHVVRKDPASVSVQWLLILPEVYEIGMSHWGLKILYEILNKRTDSLAERAFSPWVDMEDRMRRAGIPLWSLETRRPAREFDLIGFSLQYEMTATNILNALDLARIPIWARDRRNDDPLIIGGGPCVTNPEPLAEFFDAFLIGDGEEAVGRVTEAVRETKGMDRERRLRALAGIPGVYVPALYSPRVDADGRYLGTFPNSPDTPARVSRTFLPDLENAPYPERPVVPLQEVVQDRLSIEILRGCTQACRFCQAGYLYRPVRERSVDRILDLAKKGLAASGWDTIGLVSLSTADYSQLEPLTAALNDRFAHEKVSLSLPSLRADRFGIEIAQKVREVKKTGFTFAPEAGSERLRRVINKRISDEEFFEAARIVYGQGWRLIKLYVMIGLPTEKWEDVEAIHAFARRVLSVARTFGPSCKLNLSVGAFVPKSHTPFQWEAFEDIGSLREKIDYLRSTLSSKTARVKWNDLETSHIEAILSRGDRRLARAIYRAWELGCRFDGWSEHFSYARWIQAFEETGIPIGEYTRARGIEEPLPWDHIDIGIHRKFLERERQYAYEMRPTADCRTEGCVACGIPGMPDDTRLAPASRKTETRVGGEVAMASAATRETTSDSSLTMLPETTGLQAPKRPVVTSPPILWPLRMRFSKEGPARFLSHLETGTIMSRAFRIAGIPVGFSQGHSPHPKFHFGPPLPVGIAGMRELIDVEILVPWRGYMIDRLNAVLPGGYRITEVWALPSVSDVRKRSLCSEAIHGRYESDTSALDPDRREGILQAIGRFQSAAEWKVPRSRPGTAEDERMAPRPPIELKRACVELEADPTGSMIRMVLRLLDEEEGQTANPARLMRGIFEMDVEEQARCFTARTVLMRADRSPM